MTCSAYDLVLIPFPYADLSSSKKRSVLVLTAPDHHGDFIALAVTTVPQEEPAIPLTAIDLVDGTLPKPSWIRVDKVFTLSDQNIVKHIGKIKTACMEKVLKSLCSIVGYAK
ncbi:MAG TPA: type II toxin-antitoxin system PemK/MazF family toxin [Nitrospirales bacterium]|nr:type II toxin-antitoxin system PemK/MazF family toxin [Nitrospirales bacterium]